MAQYFFLALVDKMQGFVAERSPDFLREDIEVIAEEVEYVHLQTGILEAWIFIRLKDLQSYWELEG